MKKILLHKKHELILITLYTLFLSYISLVEYYKVISPILNSWTGWHQSHIDGMAPAPLQFRVLSFMIPEFFSHLIHAPIKYIYLAEKFTFTWLSFLLYYYFAKQYLPKHMAIILITVFSLIYNLTILAHFQPAEEINLFLFILAFFTITKQRTDLFLLIIFVAIFNKSTTVFLIPIYFLYHYLNAMPLKRNILNATLATIILFSVYFAIRLWYGLDREYWGGLWQYGYNFNELIKIHLYSYHFLFITFIPLYFILKSWHIQPNIVKSVAIMFPLFFIGHFLISRLEEFRTFLPIGTILLLGMFIYFEQYLNKTKHNIDETSSY